MDEVVDRGQVQAEQARVGEAREPGQHEGHAEDTTEGSRHHGTSARVTPRGPPGRRRCRIRATARSHPAAEGRCRRRWKNLQTTSGGLHGDDEKAGKRRRAPVRRLRHVSCNFGESRALAGQPMRLLQLVPSVLLIGSSVSAASVCLFARRPRIARSPSSAGRSPPSTRVSLRVRPDDGSVMTFVVDDPSSLPLGLVAGTRVTVKYETREGGGRRLLSVGAGARIEPATARSARDDRRLHNGGSGRCGGRGSAARVGGIAARLGGDRVLAVRARGPGRDRSGETRRRRSLPAAAGRGRAASGDGSAPRDRFLALRQRRDRAAAVEA